MIHSITIIYIVLFASVYSGLAVKQYNTYPSRLTAVVMWMHVALLIAAILNI